MSKGSKQRPTDKKAFDSGYELAFGKKQPTDDALSENERFQIKRRALGIGRPDYALIDRLNKHGKKDEI